jgi:hypothetical protein
VTFGSIPQKRQPCTPPTVRQKVDISKKYLFLADGRRASFVVLGSFGEKLLEEVLKSIATPADGGKITRDQVLAVADDGRKNLRNGGLDVEHIRMVLTRFKIAVSEHLDRSNLIDELRRLLVSLRIDSFACFRKPDGYRGLARDYYN